MVTERWRSSRDDTTRTASVFPPPREGTDNPTVPPPGTLLTAATIESTIESTADTTADTATDTTLDSTIDITADTVLDTTIDTEIDTAVGAANDTTIEAAVDSAAETGFANTLDITADTDLDTAIDSPLVSTTESTIETFGAPRSEERHAGSLPSFPPPLTTDASGVPADITARDAAPLRRSTPRTTSIPAPRARSDVPPRSRKHGDRQTDRQKDRRRRQRKRDLIGFLIFAVVLAGVLAFLNRPKESATPPAESATGASAVPTVPPRVRTGWISSGVYNLPGDIPPGLYRVGRGYTITYDDKSTPGSSSATFEGTTLASIPADAPKGTITIEGGAWALVDDGPVDPTQFQDGTYLVGYDLQAGTYRVTPVPHNGGKASATRLGVDNEIIQFETTARGQSSDSDDGLSVDSITIVIDPIDFAFSFEGRLERVD